ncbi:hypothetical protein ACFSHP_02570 [Novosphingobium panipatense]
MTQEMLNLQWEKMSLYPAGYYTRRIPVKPTVTFPRVGPCTPRSTASAAPATR